MSLDMVNEPARNDRSATREGQAVDEALTPEIREVLGNLALNAETHVELGDALAEADSMLASVVELHPEFQGASSELQAKLKQLKHLQATLGTAVMKYSHHYEDAAAGLPGVRT